MQKFIVLFVLVAGIFGLWFSVPEKSTAAPSNQNFSPPMWILGPIQGADGSESVVSKNLDKLQLNNIPISAFHFDAPDWQYKYDPPLKPDLPVSAWQFGYSDALLQRLKDSHIRALFWITPLVDMDKCPTDYANALANGYLVKDGNNQVITTGASYFGGHGELDRFQQSGGEGLLAHTFGRAAEQDERCDRRFLHRQCKARFGQRLDVQ